jgi:hypothetical protein
MAGSRRKSGAPVVDDDPVLAPSEAQCGPGGVAPIAHALSNAEDPGDK